jgi:hypothetical protein
MTSQTALPKASTRETLAVYGEVLIPTIAKGAIIRRPRIVGLSQRLGLDDRAVRRMQKLEESYGASTILLNVPIKSQAIILSPEDVHAVLEGAPRPFDPATDEKRAALSHFEPRNALISSGTKREIRRQFNEDVLELDRPVHRLASAFIKIVDEEIGLLIDTSVERGKMTWDEFAESWFRIVRRVIFGDSARDDHELTEMIAELRLRGNWAFFSPKHRKLRATFLEDVRERLANAEPGSLAAIIGSMQEHDKADSEHQVPQWLFAFDPAGMTTFRALALLATHPNQAIRALQEVEQDESQRQRLPYLRAVVLESLRLWPTTPMILRQTRREVEWHQGHLPDGTTLLIFTPYFHRDDRHVPEAHRFAPELWDHDRGNTEWPFVPFSGGPGLCPGIQLVLLLTSATLAKLIAEHSIELIAGAQMSANQRLPGTLNNYGLEFRLAKR